MASHACLAADDVEAGSFYFTFRAYGACLVATLRALKIPGSLSPEKYPSIEYLLKAAAELDNWVGTSEGSNINRVCIVQGHRKAPLSRGLARGSEGSP